MLHRYEYQNENETSPSKVIGNFFPVIEIVDYNKSYDNSVKFKRTEMDPFRLG